MRITALLALLLLVSPAFADFRANSTTSPRFVDTSVINQTFIYTITPSGNESINRTIITVPSGYQVVDLINVTTGSSGNCFTTICQQREVNSSRIAVNFSVQINASLNSPLVFTFLVNTSSTATAGNFTSSINSTTYSNQTENTSSLLVSTQQIFNVTNVEVLKGSAIINGTDFWEFKFTLGYNIDASSLSGLVQFKMNNWIDALGKTLNIYNTTHYFATLSNESLASNGNTSGRFAVNTTYDTTTGMNKANITSGNPLYLKMLIPSGSNLSSTWSATYGFLFRATP